MRGGPVPDNEPERWVLMRLLRRSRPFDRRDIASIETVPSIEVAERRVFEMAQSLGYSVLRRSFLAWELTRAGDEFNTFDVMAISLRDRTPELEIVHASA